MATATQPKPTSNYVRTMRVTGWADFKAKLVKIGVLSSSVDDVPEEWKKAFCKCFNRPYPMK